MPNGHHGIGSERDDVELMVAIASRDAVAFRQLVDRHAGQLHRLAWRMLGEASEAEDVVQETFLRVWDGAAAWRPSGGGLPAWLRRTSTNLCLDRIRRNLRLSDGEVPEQADPAPAADERMDVARLASIAQAALLALPDRQRAAIVLTYYEHLSNAAASDALAMNIRAFESLLVRARSTLRSAVRDAGVVAADLQGVA